MKSRLLLALCTCCVFAAVSAAPALAEFDNPPVSLDVATSAGGTVVGGVNGSGIDCGAACSLEDQPGTDSEFVGIGNGNCGANDRLMCTAVYHDVTLTAQSHLGWQFAGWGGHCSGTNTTCSFEMSGDRSVSASFTDVAPPTVGITGPSGNADGASSTNTSASFTFAADQAGSTFKCRVYPAALTPGAFGPCSGAGSHAASGLSPGTYAFEVVATDAFGNVDTTPAKRTFTVKAKPTEDKPAGGGGKPSSGGQTTGGGATSGGDLAPAGGKIDAKLNTFWKLYRKRTKAQTLTISNAPAGSKVTISCNGKGCKFRKVSSTLSGTRLKLAVRFRGKKLPARTVITVTVTKPGWIGKTFKYVTRAGKFPKLTLS